MAHLNEEANNKFLRGDALSDDDLRNLINFYGQCVHDLGQLGKEFDLAYKECRRCHDRLKDYQQARRERR